MADIYYEPNKKRVNSERRWFQNVKLVGELDEETSVYMEDYVYTYLYQYASSDLTCEKSAVLIGEYYESVDQIVVSGVIPIPEYLLNIQAKWINKEVLEQLKKEKEHYFPTGKYIGWMHTQPGYGVMLTTQEMKVHKDVFGEKGVLLLMDPIHKVEKFFTYGNDQLIEKAGFCMYYERNESMQQYMIDHPTAEQPKEEVNDTVVLNFRQMGARRKKEIQRRRKMNVIIAFTIAVLLLTAALMTGIYEQQRKISDLEESVTTMRQQYSSMEHRLNDQPVEVIFNEQIGQAPATTESKPAPLSEPTTLSSPVNPPQTLDEPKALVSPEAPVESQPVASKDSKQKSKEDEYDIYAVQTGDSLLGISYRHYKTVRMASKIAELNNIKNQDTIYIGQKLKMPKVSP